MTTPEIDTQLPPAPIDEKEERKRRSLLLVLLLLLLLICAVGCLILRYLLKPEPIADIIPVVPALTLPPNYVMSITGVDSPVGVAGSPDGKRIYVTESAGDRLIKVFDLDGNPLFSFSPPGTTKSSRAPTYIAIDQNGRVFVVDRANNEINIFDADGNYLDSIIAWDMTISKFLTQQLSGALPAGTTFFFDGGLSRNVYYTLPGKTEKTVKFPSEGEDFTPQGVRFDKLGNLIYTDLTLEKHSVHIVTADVLARPWAEFDPKFISFGSQGSENGQFNFPQVAVTDSQGNIYVSDGNNGRISAWYADLKYRSFFAFGSSESTLNLPRGLWMDEKDHLHVADAVGSSIRVYDVSGKEPVFLFNFGEFGVGEGLFNYPYDIYMDGTGRLFIADRGNNRIQVWSY